MTVPERHVIAPPANQFDHYSEVLGKGQANSSKVFTVTYGKLELPSQTFHRSSEPCI